MNKDLVEAARPQGAVHMQFHPRADVATATNRQRLRSPSSQPAQQSVVLDNEQTLSERGIMERLTSEDPVQRAVALNAFNDFATRIGDLVTGGSMVRLSNPAHFPDPTSRQAVPAAVIMGDSDRQVADMQWRALFNVVDNRTTPHPYFEIADLYHAVTFREYQMGERIEMGFVEGDNAIFKAQIFAGGLQWNRLWEGWQNLWSSGQGLAFMQFKYLRRMARLAYETLTASGLGSVAYDTTGTTQLEKDIATINKGMLEIRKGLYQDQSPKGEQTEESIEGQPFYLLYNNLTAGYEDRIDAALEARYTIANDNMSTTVQVNRPVVPIGSPDVPAGAWYLFLGGRKNVLSIHRDLQIYDIEDVRIAGVADGRVGQGAYRPVRGDAKQGKELATS